MKFNFAYTKDFVNHYVYYVYLTIFFQISRDIHGSIVKNEIIKNFILLYVGSL